MIEKEYTTVDKSSWPRGKWDDEPDKVQFMDETTKLPCLIVRNQGGALCGYVGVSKDHPNFGLNYGHESFQLPSVHGGVTFTEKCSPSTDESKGICHLVEAGEDDDVWWVGFDCGHSGDLVPAYNTRGAYSMDGYDMYKDMEYVKGEIYGLAAQLVASGKEIADV